MFTRYPYFSYNIPYTTRYTPRPWQGKQGVINKLHLPDSLSGLQVLIALGQLATHDRDQDPVINNNNTPTIVGIRVVPKYPYYPTTPYIYIYPLLGVGSEVT